MKNRITVLAFFITLSLAGFGQAYITNVSVIDVIKKKIIAGQTVVVQGEKITALKSSAKTIVPANAVQIDGSGKFLLPGMTDAHVHFFQSGGLYARPDAIDLRKTMPYETELAWVHANMEDLLRRYVKAGITSVIDVGASYSFLQQRDSFANKNYAPGIYMTGPLLTSYEPAVFKNLKNEEPFKLFTSAEDAVKLVQEQLAFHPDFIKIWYIVSGGDAEKNARKYQPVVKAIIDEAHKNNLKVAVHATERITARLAVESGCDFLVHGVEDEIINSDFCELLKNKKVVLCPTLIVPGGYANSFAQTTNFSDYELATANPQQIGSLFDLKHLPDTAKINSLKKYFGSAAQKIRNAHEDSVRMVNLKKLADAGVVIAAGTDAGNIGTQHASSFLAELKAMRQSGLTNWSVIQAATINGAKVLGNENNFGSITPGKNANMVLLNANPLDNLDNLSKIAFVVNRGFFIQPDTLIKETPAALVQRQLNAYNARNISAFLEPYADNVELYNFPDKLIAKGKEAMIKNYADFFKNTPQLHCQVTQRLIEGNTVVDHESVTYGGKKPVTAVAVYEIKNDKISKVYFIK